MTGYGEASADVDGSHYFVQIRSLNGKYFKASVRLQEEFEAIEPELETKLRRHVTRGSITLKATVTDDSEQAAHEINIAALDNYISQFEQSYYVKSGRVAVEIGSLLRLPGVLQPASGEDQRIGRVKDVFVRLTDEACRNLLKMRATEGEGLAEDLRHHLDVIAEHLEDVRQRAPEVVTDYEARLRQRIDQLLTEAGASGDRIEIIREVASYAERTDIAEEISRLGGHLEQFRMLLESAGDKPVGRTLDFMSQELLREANTMSSKSMDTRISRSIVEIKGAIDRIKEQVQNVE